LLKELENEEEKPEAVSLGTEEIAMLFGEIEPLLEKNDFVAVGFVEKLQGIAGMEELAELIDDYDFSGALALIQKLKSE